MANPSDHKLKILAVRAIEDESGVTHSQARAQLKKEVGQRVIEAQGRRAAAAKEELANRPASKITVDESRSNPPLPFISKDSVPKAGEGGQQGGSPMTLTGFANGFIVQFDVNVTSGPTIV